MSPTYRKVILILSIWALVALACDIFTPEYVKKIHEEATLTTIAKKTLQEPTEVLSPADKDFIERMNADRDILFTYAGENQSYHTGLRNKTIFSINYSAAIVTAEGRAAFEEPFGTQTSWGTDTIRFKGIYDDVNKSFSGDLIITTEATANGSGSSPTNINYTMTGKMSAKLVNDQWIGDVTGNATLTQTWPEGPNADYVTPYTIAWTVTGTHVE